MRHVAELRVAVAESARRLGVGRRLLQLAFEMVVNVGATKIIARMTRDQLDAQRLFQQLGFEQEAVLRDHALSENGLTHDLLVLAFQPHKRQEQTCDDCGVPVLNALVVDGAGFARNATKPSIKNWAAAIKPATARPARRPPAVGGVGHFWTKLDTFRAISTSCGGILVSMERAAWSRNVLITLRRDGGHTAEREEYGRPRLSSRKNATHQPPHAPLSDFVAGGAWAGHRCTLLSDIILRSFYRGFPGWQTG